MAVGDLTAVLDTLEFDTVSAGQPYVVHVSEDVYAVAYDGTGGVIKTFTIDKDGNIGNAVIATADYDGIGRVDGILRVFGSVFVVVNRIDDRVTLATVTINPDGTFGAAIIDTLGLEVPSPGGWTGRIIHVSGDVYAVCSCRNITTPPTLGRLATVTIDSVGNIGAAAIDTLEFEASASVGQSITHVDGDMYAISYTGTASDDTVVITLEIEADGQIAAAVTDTEIIEAAPGGGANSTHLLQVSGTTYALAYIDSLSDGFIATFTITAAGAISAVIATLEFETATCVTLYFMQVRGAIYAVAYRGVDSDGFIKSMQINADGTLGAVLGTLEFDVTLANNPSLARVVGSVDILVIAYSGPDGDGFAKTVGVTTPLGVTGYLWVEGGTGQQNAGLHYIDADSNEQIAGFTRRTFSANSFLCPAPGTGWTPQITGINLAQSLAALTAWLPLHFLKASDEIVSYNLVGDAVEVAALTLDCKLVRVNKADPLTTTDVAGGAITKVSADGNFDSAATLTAVEVVATDRQYVLEITGTTGVGDSITVIGAEVVVNRK